MAIRVTNGFEVRAKQPIDTRILLTKAEMIALSDKVMPQNYFCICNDEDEDKGKIFIYDKSSTASLFTGKFRPFEEIIDMAQAISEALQDPTKRSDFLEAMVDMFNDEQFTIIDDKIELALSCIEAIDGNK